MADSLTRVHRVHEIRSVNTFSEQENARSFRVTIIELLNTLVTSGIIAEVHLDEF